MGSTVAQGTIDGILEFLSRYTAKSLTTYRLLCPVSTSSAESHIHVCGAPTLVGYHTTSSCDAGGLALQFGFRCRHRLV